MILQALSVSPLRSHSFQFIQTEPTHGLAGIYVIVKSFFPSPSLIMSYYTKQKINCQEKICSKNIFF